MMIVRCPNCQTVFRMRPEQLRAHAGMVRCGQCLTAFNALDHLMDETLQPDPLAHATQEQEQPPEASPPTPNDDEDQVFVLEDATALDQFGADLNLWDFEAPTESPAMESPPARTEPQSTFDRVADRLEFEIPDAFLPSRQAAPRPQAGAESVPVEPEAERESGTYSAAATPTQYADATSSGDDIHPALAAYLPINPPPEQVDSWAADATEDHPARSSVAAEHEPEPTRSESRWTTANRDTDESPVPERDAWRRTALYESAAERPTGRRWLWGLGVGILMGTLAVQAAFLFREEITRSWPLLRPLYVELCTHLGCTMPLPRVAGAIRITSSHLESDPADPTRFVLNARIRNEAHHPQEHPHLELTLTDTRERPVVRRVLLPAEWVAGDRLGAGFRAGEEIKISLPFEATDVTTAVGYRVYAFFP